MPTAISRMLQGRSATRLQNSRSLWDRPYSLSRLPATLRAAIAASDDAAIAIEFSRAVTKRRLGVDPSRFRVPTQRSLPGLVSSLGYSVTRWADMTT